MEVLRRLFRRVSHVGRQAAHDRDLQEEIALHLAMRAEELRDEGVPDADAAARRAFGSVVVSRERSREAWGLLWWQHAFVTRLTRAVAEQPGVANAGLVSELPLSGMRVMHNLIVERQPPLKPGTEPEIFTHEMTGGAFDALGIAVRSGRAFTPHDMADAPLVGIVNERFVREILRGDPPLGRRVRWARLDEVRWITIVGVVGDVHFQAVDEPEPATIYTPMTQKLQAWKRWTAIVVRPLAGAPMTLAPALRRAVWDIDPALPVTDVQPLQTLVADALEARRLQLVMMVLFAAVALALAVTGIYGVVSYLVAERAMEMSVRMAIGATPRAVVGLLMGEGALLAGVGVCAGVAAALLATRGLQRLLFEVSPTDPLSFGMVLAMLIASVLIAVAVPAWRAAGASPALLRTER